MTAPDPLLVIILGPTASGKTALSLALAERFAGEIVNCDSVAVYREFEIGTAKPSAAERARAPHHLFDIVAPTELMTAGEYARRARTVLNDIKARGRMPIIVGGTGLYLRALIEGLSPGPQRSEELRRRLRAIAHKRSHDLTKSDVTLSEASTASRVEGFCCHPERMRLSLPRESKDLDAPIRAADPERSKGEALNARILIGRGEHPYSGSHYLHRILRRLDPRAAARVHPHDQPKIIRAIEVCLEARRPLTDVWQTGRDPLRGFRILRLGLDPDRAALYARINDRAARMFASGLVEETAALLTKYMGGAPLREAQGGVAKGKHVNSIRPLDSMGYKQAVQLLRGEIDLPTAIAASQQAHRNYAKRQITWFRREPNVHWLHGFGDAAALEQQAIEVVERHFTWPER